MNPEMYETEFELYPTAHEAVDAEISEREEWYPDDHFRVWQSDQGYYTTEPTAVETGSRRVRVEWDGACYYEVED